MRRLALLASLWPLLAGGCVVVHHGLPQEGFGRSEHALSAPEVVRAKEIHASRVKARVIYAKEVHAHDGYVGAFEPADGREGWPSGELHTASVVADEIHAKEIHADWIEAEVIIAKEAKIGRDKFGG